jgi:hypothetical protein
MIAKETLPGLQWSILPRHHGDRNRGLRNIDIQFEQLTMDPGSTPQWVFKTHSSDQLAHLFADPWWPPRGRDLHRQGLVTPIRACGPAGGQVARGMKKISHKGYRFPLEIIQQAIWLYVRFTLSFRDVEDLLAERGIMVSYETVRRWGEPLRTDDRGEPAQTPTQTLYDLAF